MVHSRLLDVLSEHQAGRWCRTAKIADRQYSREPYRCRWSSPGRRIAGLIKSMLSQHASDHGGARASFGDATRRSSGRHPDSESPVPTESTQPAAVPSSGLVSQGSQPISCGNCQMRANSQRAGAYANYTPLRPVLLSRQLLSISHVPCVNMENCVYG